MVQAYDVKAKRKAEILNPQLARTKNNRYVIVGTSSLTGNRIQTFVSNKAIQQAQRGDGFIGDMLGIRIPVLGDIPLLNRIF